ncbi:DEAD/DEAH box helicase [Litorimonas sp. RW-G-Af-16]|uniref:DEAD/DEAH box helicase n=1 Tax=Litorimonas sp. RW-G-Af-16 TaxID=3241168 RepID=UPI00390CA576
MSTFSDLNLAAPLDKALRELGYDTPTEIQVQAIPKVMEGRDLMGIAQTGTGKTAAFTLPTLHYLITEDKEPPKRGARCLILAPTRELAGQITESVQQYGKHMPHLSVTAVYGGVAINRQIKRLVGGNDVVVATPGRLMDLIERRALTLKDVEVLILDEADQMMDMGFIHALRKIVKMLPKERQTLFFSATMATNIKKLAAEYLTDPVKVSVTPANTTAERVTQAVIFAESPQKQTLLGLELIKPEVERALVFTRTKHGADRVVKRLATNGLRAMAIHGNKSQSQRQRALDAFKAGDVNIMVATDIAARGIDIDDITHVFNYELPNVAEQYVHRIGRTARARKSGKAISFVAKDERNYLRDIEKLLGEKIPQEKQIKDIDEAAKVLRARAPVEVVADKVKETRQGRGKSKKKKARFSSDRANRGAGAYKVEEVGERTAKSGYDPDKPSQPRGRGKPASGGKPKGEWSRDTRDGSGGHSARPNKMRGDSPTEDSTTHRRKKSDPNKKSRAQRKTETAAAAPKSDGKSKSFKGKPYKAKGPRADGRKPSGGKPQDAARQSSGGAGFQRKPRKPKGERGASQNKGGNQPPKRRAK